MKKDCFAYKRGAKHLCVALKDPCCEDCKFYKTKEQYNNDLNKLSWNARLYRPI